MPLFSHLETGFRRPGLQETCITWSLPQELNKSHSRESVSEGQEPPEFMMGAMPVSNSSLDNPNKAQYQYSLRAVIVHSGGNPFWSLHTEKDLLAASLPQLVVQPDSAVRQVRYEEVSKTPPTCFLTKRCQTQMNVIVICYIPSGCASINNEDSYC